jgi:hypothetical protein
MESMHISGHVIAHHSAAVRKICPVSTLGYSMCHYNAIPIDPNRPKLYELVILTRCLVTSLDMCHHWFLLALHIVLTGLQPVCSLGVCINPSVHARHIYV